MLGETGTNEEEDVAEIRDDGDDQGARTWKRSRGGFNQPRRQIRSGKCSAKMTGRIDSVKVFYTFK